jgi:mannose-1-phosphate guanylyltransferase/phosphomannomutase
LNDLEWVILAGGLGTRSENPSLPKILQEVGGRKLIDFLVDSILISGFHNVTFVLRHGLQDVVEHLERAQVGLDWKVIEDSGAGPVSALKLAASKVESSQIGCILGDTAMQAPLSWFFEQHVLSGKRASVVVRQSNHLSDSDTFSLDHQGKVMDFSNKGGPTAGQLGQVWGASGILFVAASVALELTSGAVDVASSLVEVAGLGAVNCIRSSFYHRDSGTPRRLLEIRNDFESGFLTYPRDLTGSRRGLFLDRDGTLVPDIPEGRVGVNLEDINPKMIRTISLAKKRGVPVFLVTNQPAVAKGYISFLDVFEVHNKIQRILSETENVTIDDFAFCPHHPEPGHVGEIPELKIGCDCRKPSSGMLIRLAKVHKIDLSKSVFIGDSFADQFAAERVKMKFYHVAKYRDAEISSHWEDK